MEFPIIKYSQNSHQLISTVLPFEIINLFSHVLVYGKDDGGYQREPDPKHYNNIKNYINEHQTSPSFIFPTSIILGIDEDVTKAIISEGKEVNTIKLEKTKSAKIFRIIDGQHRVRGLNEALSTNNEINKVQLSVVILITPPNSRSIEMQIFNTINSKSKRIKVDLIQLASFEYRILESKIELTEVNEHISVQVANLLNEDSSKTNKWFNAIKFGIHDEQKVGIIGVNAFRESIRALVTRYLQLNIDYHNLKGSKLIEFTRVAAERIKIFLLHAWEIIYEKWQDCFSQKSQEVDYDLEIKEFYYKNDYYIQKTLGTKAINYLLGSIVSEGDHKIDQESLLAFKKYILDSNLLNSDWKVGNTFSGYSSESAFGKVSKIVKGEIPIPRN
ncbi:MAG: DGQHR domain-containing protein [Bacteroidota bacterium]